MTTLETLLHDPDLAGGWNLVLDRSAITFKVRNMWGLVNVKGRFTDFTGDGQLTGKGAVFGRVDIRAASLDTGIVRRDKHLRSADFFDVDRFPEIGVVVTALRPTTGKAADVRANFTIKGITAELPLPVTISELDDGSVRVAGETTLDRARFDLGWNRLGMIGPTVTAAAEAIFVRESR
ncbi:YceI family protein [Mycobacterium intracellulare]|uniref:YceI family protein n=1 Tax=Mycobacterium intracellulare TaxID=1767 RepID=UPI000475129F|nr:YceI family protein [Mycobacterium intracellulare]MDM3894884.1 YceI family protein [Mycobacterium intracellulare]